jgi:hypothetical protein
MSAKKSTSLMQIPPIRRRISPEFKILETFVNLGNLRTFRRAVKTLNTTQPLVSMRIKPLTTSAHPPSAA